MNKHHLELHELTRNGIGDLDGEIILNVDGKSPEEVAGQIAGLYDGGYNTTGFKNNETFITLTGEFKAKLMFDKLFNALSTKTVYYYDSTRKKLGVCQILPRIHNLFDNMTEAQRNTAYKRMFRISPRELFDRKSSRFIEHMPQFVEKYVKYVTSDPEGALPMFIKRLANGHSALDENIVHVLDKVHEYVEQNPEKIKNNSLLAHREPGSYKHELFIAYDFYTQINKKVEMGRRRTYAGSSYRYTDQTESAPLYEYAKRKFLENKITANEFLKAVGAASNVGKYLKGLEEELSRRAMESSELIFQGVNNNPPSPPLIEWALDNLEVPPEKFDQESIVQSGGTRKGGLSKAALRLFEKQNEENVVNETTYSKIVENLHQVSLNDEQIKDLSEIITTTNVEEKELHHFICLYYARQIDGVKNFSFKDIRNAMEQHRLTVAEAIQLVCMAA